MLDRLGKLIGRLFRSGTAEVCAIVLEDLVTSAESNFASRGIRLNAVNEDALRKNGENLYDRKPPDTDEIGLTYHCIPTHETNSQFPRFLEHGIEQSGLMLILFLPVVVWCVRLMA